MGVRDVIGFYRDVEGNPSELGWVVMTPSARLVSANDNEIVPTQPVYGVLQNGAVVLSDMLTTDTPGITPEGWTYHVHERIRDSEYVTYSIELPSGMGPFDLAEAEHVEPVDQMAAYIPTSALAEPGDLLTRGPSGVTALPVGADGRVLTADSSQPLGLIWAVPSGGGSGDGSYYEHVQSSPAATWTINHGLGYRPNVAVIDSDGNNLDAGITWPSLNSVTIGFSATVAGRAYLS